MSEGPQNIPQWPASWPGNEVVDLDNLSDPGFWIEQHIPNPSEMLSGSAVDDDQLADELTYGYLRAASELSFPLPSDFDVTDEEAFQTVKEDFVGFIREWKKRAAQKES